MSRSDRPEDIEILDVANDTVWRFDPAFLSSNWTCLWGRGCKGILEHPAEDLGQGCCSLGAELDDDEARNLSALTATLAPEHFQFHNEADNGIFGPGSGDRPAVDGNGSTQGGWHTRVVDEACIFLNRPGFAGGEGCALHLEALAADESPLDWKPSVCWQLPLHVDWAPAANGGETASVRGWNRSDWGRHGTTMDWCCTEGRDAYIGEDPVIDSLSEEIEAMVGTAVYLELKRRIDP